MFHSVSLQEEVPWFANEFVPRWITSSLCFVDENEVRDAPGEVGRLANGAELMGPAFTDSVQQRMVLLQRRVTWELRSGWERRHDQFPRYPRLECRKILRGPVRLRVKTQDSFTEHT